MIRVMILDIQHGWGLGIQHGWPRAAAEASSSAMGLIVGAFGRHCVSARERALETAMIVAGK